MAMPEDQAARLAAIRERHALRSDRLAFQACANLCRLQGLGWQRPLQVSPCDAAYLLSLLDRLTQERDAYRRAAAWLLEEGGWRATYYEMSGPCPSVIDRRDSINPRLKPPAQLTEADLAAPEVSA